jgi:hypothetical protein
MEGTAKAGSGTLTGMAAPAAADTAVAMLPATAAVPVAGAVVAAGTEPDWWHLYLAIIFFVS